MVSRWLRVARIFAYVAWALMGIFGYLFVSVKTEYTRGRPQSPREDLAQVVQAEGFYNKTIFLTEEEARRLDRATYFAYGMFVLCFVGMGTVHLLERRSQPRP
jgi:hypothetical protein